MSIAQRVILALKRAESAEQRLEKSAARCYSLTQRCERQESKGCTRESLPQPYKDDETLEHSF